MDLSSHSSAAGWYEVPAFMLSFNWNKVGRIATGPCARDGRIIVESESEVEFLGGPTEAVAVKDIAAGFITLREVCKTAPDVIVSGGTLVVRSSLASKLLDCKTPGIGVLPISVESSAGLAEGYSWIYCSQALRLQDIVDANYDIAHDRGWFVSLRAMEIFKKERVKGVQFIPVVKSTLGTGDHDKLDEA